MPYIQLLQNIGREGVMFLRLLVVCFFLKFDGSSNYFMNPVFEKAAQIFDIKNDDNKNINIMIWPSCFTLFPHNHGSVENGYIIERYRSYWRDPFLTSMIMGGSVTYIGLSPSQ